MTNMWGWLALVPKELHHADAHSGGGEDLASMPFAYVQIGIVVFAAAVQMAWFAIDVGRRINAVQLGTQLRKLVQAGNTERGVKLCDAAPNSPITRLAKVGLEARLHNGDALGAMRAAFDSNLGALRSGLIPTLAIGAIAIAEGLVLIARETDAGEVGVKAFGPLVLLAIVFTLNALRWGMSRRELETITEMVGR